MRGLLLSVGATGSIGRPVLAEALARGYRVRALVRAPGRRLPDGVEIVLGDLTRSETLAAAVADVDQIVFTHGNYAQAEAVDYGAVRNVLIALNGRRVRIALMTTIGVTDRKGSHDWKRRGERLVRASGNPYTIVRPGWFDYNGQDERQIVMLQGDRRQSGTPRDGAIARDQLARVLVASLTSDAAAFKTLELISARGSVQADLEPVFAKLAADTDPLDGARDMPNMPFDDEPAAVRHALDTLRQSSPTSSETA